jgi:hypothetical protein
MKSFSNIALVAVFGAGCAMDHAPGEPEQPEQPGQPEDPQQPTPTNITILIDQPALLAYRDETSTAWRSVDTGAARSVQIPVTGPYRVIVACVDDSLVSIVEFARTPGDGLTLDEPCLPASSRPFVVRGEMVQPGEVFLGGAGRGESRAPWSFELPAAAGTSDLLMLVGAFDKADRVAVRRDLAITGDLDLGTIDAEHSDAQDLVPVTFTADNADPDEVLTQTTSLTLGNASAILSDSFFLDDFSWNTRLVPDSVLRANDRQAVSLGASINTTTETVARSVHRRIGRRIHVGDSTSITLPEHNDAITFAASGERLAVTWASLPEHSELSLRRDGLSDDGTFWDHELLLSPLFVAATGATSAALDFTGVPGFKAEWSVAGTSFQTHGFDASTAGSPDTASIGVDESVLATQPERALRFDGRQAQLARQRVHRRGPAR